MAVSGTRLDGPDGADSGVAGGLAEFDYLRAD